MVLTPHRSKPAAGIPTSSLADIAFLLLVFFLVTTVFDEEKGLPIVLPAPGDIVKVPDDAILHLLVHPGGVIEVRQGGSPLTRKVAAGEVGDIWRLAVAENPALIAAVQTDPDAAYRHMVDVLDALQEAGAKRIALSALDRAPPR